MLQASKDKRGYTDQELKDICKKYKISEKKFNQKFGVNTCIMAEDGTTRYYRCDVLRALYLCGIEDGEYSEWD